MFVASGHSDNLGPPLKKWATTSPSASTVEQYNTSDPSGRREKDQSACSQTSWCLNPEVEEFVPRQSAVPVEKPGPSVGRHAETAEPKSEEQALEPVSVFLFLNKDHPRTPDIRQFGC